MPTLFASGWIEDRFTASTKNPECQLGVFFFCVESMFHSSFFCQEYLTTSFMDCQILLLAALCSSFFMRKNGHK
ncbi:hypothetical protein, partial [Phascolarctobacterium succinatutens]|uniref:hypothetical protein n=1 Tax=Phascolarctobacterium succinatutens TaxID=626940 RepID=UPI0026F1DEAF